MVKYKRFLVLVIFLPWCCAGMIKFTCMNLTGVIDFGVFNWPLIRASDLLGSITTLYLGAMLIVSPKTIGEWLLKIMPENGARKVKEWWQKNDSPSRVFFLRLLGLFILLLTSYSSFLDLNLLIEALHKIGQ